MICDSSVSSDRACSSREAGNAAEGEQNTTVGHTVLLLVMLNCLSLTKLIPLFKTTSAAVGKHC